jgi:type VI secretion system secreted protein VgrG
VASTVNVGGNAKFEIYDYPGEYLKKPEGSDLVKIRMEEEEASNLVVNGASTCRAFVSGYRFNLTEHYRQDMNKAYVLSQLGHTASAGESYTGGDSGAGEGYSNQFTCIPHSVPFRPLRVTPKPVVQGVQTAVVVGKQGEEIWTDKYGRVKVQFHWDREGKRDENSSCWIRVSQPWAGKGWGTVSIPRIGQEVIVEFLEGDPDQPIITGRVYNAELMPPYTLPDGGVVSGWKSKTHKGAGYNEMSMDDTKGKEKVTIHAQYDMNTTIEHDETHTVKTGNRTITVETGTHTETIKGDTTITIQTGNHKLAVQSGTQDTGVKGAITITSQTANINLDAATSIKLHTGASTIELKSDGTIKIEGVDITIKGSASVTTKGAVVHSEADAEHQIKGAIVLSEGSATNTVKGGMVMLNP